MKAMFSFLLMLPLIIYAQIPKFLDAGFIKANNNILIYSYACPYVWDWDGDGKKDLLLGLFKPGKIVVYNNSGTDKDPLFMAPTFLKAGGIDINLSSG